MYSQQIAIYDPVVLSVVRGSGQLVLACSLLMSAVLHLDVFTRRGEVVQRSLGVSLDRLATFSPADGADLSMLVL